MDVCPENQYAITLYSKEISLNGKGKDLVPGSIIKIKTLNEYGHITFSVVMINDQIVPSPHVYNSPDIINIELFSEDIFKFIVAIKSAADRVNFIKLFDKRALVMKLVPGEPILVPETAFNRFQRNFRRGLVKYVGCVDEMGPGYHFIVSILDSNIKDRRDWCQIPSHLNGIIERYIGKSDFLSVILSAEHIYHYRTEEFPVDAKLFHAYNTSNMSNMRNIEHLARLNNGQSYAKRIPSNIFGTLHTLNNKTISNTSTKKPFRIDATTDADNADVEIIQKTEYFDQLDLLKSQIWPTSARPQSEIPSSKYDESSSTTSRYAQSARHARVKVPNPLDHCNQDTPRNKATSSKTSTEKPFCIDGKDVYVIDATTDADNADFQIIQKTEYFDHLAFLKSKTWPKSSVPQSEVPNSKHDESSSTTARYAKSARHARVKVPNSLDHCNQDSENDSKDIPATYTTSNISSLRKPQPSHESTVSSTLDEAQALYFLRTSRNTIPMTDATARSRFVGTPILIDSDNGVGLPKSHKNLPDLFSESQSLTKRKLPNIPASGNSISLQGTDNDLASEQPNHVSCPVCLESSVGRQPHITKCGHIFCGSCIRESIRIASNCPLCQNMLSIQMIFPVYM